MLLSSSGKLAFQTECDTTLLLGLSAKRLEMARLLLLPEILAHLSSVCTKSRPLIDNRKKSARLLSFAYLFTKEQCILLACGLKSKVTFIMHCRNTGNELTNKSNCHSSVQGRSKYIAMFSGKIKTTMIYHIP